MLQKDLQYYKSLEYNVIIKKEELDGERWYVAYCNELGLNACHGIGQDRVSALNSFIEEKDAFIEMLYEKGEAIPEVSSDETDFSGVFSVRTSPWIHSSLVNQAKKNGVSLNCYVNQLLSYGVAANSTSMIYEQKISEIGARLSKQNETILEKLNSINYKTNSILGESSKERFSPKGGYRIAI